MLVDVRSPAEFAHAHIPGAINIPLLDNEERHAVGLTYKTISQEAAFDLGLKLVGPKLIHMVEAARVFDEVEVYCWRGGMRSNFVGYLFQMAGIPTSILQGGYKTYRRKVLATLKKSYKFMILTGMTGSGKTEILRKKQQYIDLEELANHRGSAFGYLGPQPSNEHLENLIADKLLNFNDQEIIWLEDESRVIGSCKVPDDIFSQMVCAPNIEVNCSLEERVKRLVLTYGNCETSFLERGIRKLEKRLGLQRMQEALSLLKNNEIELCFCLLLEYYDKAYAKSRNRYNGRNEHTFSG